MLKTIASAAAALSLAALGMACSQEQTTEATERYSDPAAATAQTDYEAADSLTPPALPAPAPQPAAVPPASETTPPAAPEAPDGSGKTG